ncbi:RNase adapter RapZ [Chitinivorax sp. B]|uniref:RNase adapter RapZ n=1 Tax=Chitinivorax sp. B TaxID=2502235 RepID=UPI0010F497E0|nr:RNase adapter RapZ [Chitinivorax sp. B]
MQLIIISGLSGSGKSVALKVLEDGGFYCIDNLPTPFLPQIASYLQADGHDKLAISVDVRGGPSIDAVPQQLDALRAQGVDVRLLFLEAKTETLVKRFSETRRRHPLAMSSLTVTEAIALEREMLASVGDFAHRIDTSDLNSNTLRNWVKTVVDMDQSRLTLIVESFGFKHGIPLDADLVFDVRSLPNPHYVPDLKPLTGRDQPVVDFLKAQTEVCAMYDDIESYIARWLPSFVRDNRSYLTVAIGCTGGQHRSVYFAEQLGKRFSNEQQVIVRHRELA